LSRTNLVSILIPVIRTTWLRESIESALSQTYKNTEILVAGVAEIGEFIKDYPVEFILNENTKANARLLLSKARGEYIKFLCDDDVLKPTCVKTLKKGLDRNGVSLATSHRQLIDSDGELLPATPINSFWNGKEQIMNGRIMLHYIPQFKSNVIGEPTTTLFRKADVDTWRTFDGWEDTVTGDITTWAHLMTKGNLYYSPKPLSQFRQHSGQEQHKAEYLAKAQANWDELAMRIKNNFK